MVERLEANADILSFHYLHRCERANGPTKVHKKERPALSAPGFPERATFHEFVVEAANGGDSSSCERAYTGESPVWQPLNPADLKMTEYDTATRARRTVSTLS
ncbi:isoleucyl-trna synthase [Qipengyuania citrea LAMA 915]|uniref:Isoleucyl-trna synthase n=1 Tax=Qipengyuania citrea LAMA 915 TaxID=1306953 RepID=A0A0L1KI71_9SPHN|nr:isoleucyl-trna synthase [Qipengyuania citrea LAMA 915]